LSCPTTLRRAAGPPEHANVPRRGGDLWIGRSGGEVHRAVVGLHLPDDLPRDVVITRAFVGFDFDGRNVEEDVACGRGIAAAERPERHLRPHLLIHTRGAGRAFLLTLASPRRSARVTVSPRGRGHVARHRVRLATRTSCDHKGSAESLSGLIEL
jgi:hypothetical protein